MADGEPSVVEHVERVMPDTLAQIFWLKNRRPRDWRDRHEHIREHRVTDVRRMTTAQLYAALEQMDDEDRAAAGTQLALPAPERDAIPPDTRVEKTAR